jgi:deoxyribose-phosphate aldolase
MKKHVGKNVKIKAAGGVRTLDDLLRVRAVGVDRVGATATGVILDEAVRRGIGSERVEIEVPPFPKEHGGGGY